MIWTNINGSINRLETRPPLTKTEGAILDPVLNTLEQRVELERIGLYGDRLLCIVLSRIGGGSNWAGLDMHFHRLGAMAIPKQTADLILLRSPLFPHLLRSGLKKLFKCFRHNLHAVECAHAGRPTWARGTLKLAATQSPAFILRPQFQHVLAAAFW